ncbi:MAG: hypothetical protein FWB72_02265 [Firmicutes bacterium]|nr:hypothetical protein [Bacillota bacterium]
MERNLVLPTSGVFVDSNEMQYVCGGSDAFSQNVRRSVNVWENYAMTHSGRRARTMQHRMLSFDHGTISVVGSQAFFGGGGGSVDAVFIQRDRNDNILRVAVIENGSYAWSYFAGFGQFAGHTHRPQGWGWSYAMA